MPLKSGQLRKGLRNISVGVSAIPDSAVLHVDATQESFSDGDSVSTITDFSGEGNDLTGGSPSYQADVRNGNAVYRFDGMDDALGSSSPSLSRPVTVIAAVQQNDNGGSQTIYSTESDGSDRANTIQRFTDVDDDIRHLNADEGEIVAGSPNTNWRLHTLRFLESGTVLRVNGTDLATGSGGTSGWGGFRLGNVYANSQDWWMDGDIGEALLCDVDLESTGELGIEEQRIADKWGITI